MVCPYCNNHPLPNSQICNHCGIIFKLVKKSRKPKTVKSGKGLAPAIFSAVIGAFVLSAIGWLVARTKFPGDKTYEVAFSVIGFLIGAALGFCLVTAAPFFKRASLLAKRRSIQSKISKIEDERQAALEKAIGPQDNLASKMLADKTANLNPAQRMDLATEHLILGQIDDGMQQLEQVYRQAPTASVAFLNNCGVAFARRGQFQVALDRFSQACSVSPKSPEPRVNMLLSVAQTRDKSSVLKALASQNGQMDSLTALPSGLNRLSIVYAMGGESQKALSTLDSALHGNKELIADAHNDIGVVKALNQEWRESVHEFSQAMHIDTGEACAIANIGLVYHSQGKPEEAAQKFSTASAIDPHNAKLRALYGSALCKVSAINEGIREFREARIHDNSLYESNYNLGKVYIENGILDQAEHCLARAVEINPYSWQTLVAQAVLYFKLNRIHEAIDAYKNAHLAHPNEPIVLGGMAVCMALQGDYGQADVLFTRAMEKDLRDPDLLNNYAWFYLIQSQNDKAMEQLEKVLDTIDSKHAHACANMGLCQHAMGAYETAQQYFKQALASDPDLTNVHYNMGCNFIDQKAIENAIKSWENAKKVEHGNADLHTNLGVAYYRKDQFEKASAEFRRVLHLRQESAIDYANLGLTLARMKRHKEAIEQFELGIQIDEMNPMLHSNLGLACYFANRVEDAMREWGIVSRINKQYALMRASKQQSEYDDASIAYIQLFPQERAVYTSPKVPDFVMNFVPSYSASHLDLIIGSPDLVQLKDLRFELARIDRRIRATQL